MRIGSKSSLLAAGLFWLFFLLGLASRSRMGDMFIFGAEAVLLVCLSVAWIRAARWSSWQPMSREIDWLGRISGWYYGESEVQRLAKVEKVPRAKGEQPVAADGDG